MEYYNVSSIFFNNNIDDKKIKKLILQYRDDKITFNQVVEYLATLIYSYPKLIYSMDEDTCGNFFEYIFVRLEKILSYYTITEVKFMTWFTVVLRRHFYNWLKSKTKKNKEFLTLNKPVDDRKINEIIDLLVYDNSPDHDLNSDILEAIESLPPKEEIIFKLHYFDFFSEKDLINASKIYNRDIKTLFFEYYKLKDLYAKRNEKIYTLQEKLSKVYEKYMNLKNRKGIKEREIIKVRKKYEKKINELKSSLVTLTYIEIANFLGINAGIVSNFLYRGRNMLVDKLARYKNE